MNEAETRAEHIDPALATAGWWASLRAAACCEAKAREMPLTGGLAQAQDYAAWLAVLLLPSDSIGEESGRAAAFCPSCSGTIISVPGRRRTWSTRGRLRRFVDFETTGFAAMKCDRVVEIGVVCMDHSGEIVEEWTTLVNPTAT